MADWISKEKETGGLSEGLLMLLLEKNPLVFIQ